jgi:signal transduction histidine kinase
MRKYQLTVCTVTLFISLACNRNNTQKDTSSQVISMDSIKEWTLKARQSRANEDLKNFYLLKATNAVETQLSDSLKMAGLSQLSLTYSYLKDSVAFSNVNNRVREYALENNDSILLAEALWDKGAFALNALSDRDSAYYYYSRAQKIYLNIRGNELKAAQLLRSIAVVQTAIHDNTGALVTLTDALDLLKPLNDNWRLYQTYQTMGVAASGFNQFERALDYYNTAYEYLLTAEQESKELPFARLSNNKGLVYYGMGEYEKAASEYLAGLQNESLRLEYPATYARLIENLALAQNKLGNKTTVEQDMQLALFIRDSMGDIEGMSRSHYNLAQFYLDNKDTAKAKAYANKAIDLSKELNNNFRLLETLQLFTKLDPENAALHSENYIRLSDSLQQVERQIGNKFANIRFETEETLAENEVLAKQNLIWIGIAIGIFLFAISLYIIVMQRAKNQRLKFQQQQQEANQEIFNLMLAQKQKLEEGKHYEQKRISEELHDGVLGEMNGVRMILLGLNKKGDEAAIALREQAIEKLKEVQEEIRAISHELNDASYQKFNNFMNSIQELLKNVCEPAKIKSHLSFDQDMDWDSLEGITKINLYRIVQESVQNSIKHAQASTIYISFETNAKHMSVSIQDDGIGFDTGKGKRGIGHKNIKSRIEKLKGKYYLRSAPEIGTTVVLEIPMERISLDEKKEISLTEDMQEV